MSNKIIKLCALVSVLLGVGGLLALAVSGPGYQNGWWSLATAFRKLFAYGAKAGMVASVLGLIALIGNKLITDSKSKVALLGLIGLLTGLVATGLPMAFKRKAAAHPLHDITTNTTNPPSFQAILPLRANAPNPPEYDASIANRSQQLYPELKTLISSASKEALFKQALASVKKTDWVLVNENSQQGIIEATDTTFWYGFKDDIVIRIQATNNGSALDIRSKSRIGGSDVGANSERIIKFLENLN